jgi:hypothetical protein
VNLRLCDLAKADGMEFCVAEHRRRQMAYSETNSPPMRLL